MDGTSKPAPGSGGGSAAPPSPPPRSGSGGEGHVADPWAVEEWGGGEDDEDAGGGGKKAWADEPRDFQLHLLDFRESMFDPNPEGKTLVGSALNAIASVMKTKAVSAWDDKVGVFLLGTVRGKGGGGHTRGCTGGSTPNLTPTPFFPPPPGGVQQ